MSYRISVERPLVIATVVTAGTENVAMENRWRCGSHLTEKVGLQTEEPLSGANQAATHGGGI